MKYEEVRKALLTKMESGEEYELDSPEEYAVAVGEVLAYFGNLKNDGYMKHNFVNPFLTAKTQERLQELLRNIFLKLDNKIAFDNEVFRKLYASIVSYSLGDKKPDDALIETAYIRADDLKLIAGRK